MTWDPFDLPRTPPGTPGERHQYRVPAEPVKGRTVAIALVAIVLLAIAFTIAANAQETTIRIGSQGDGQQAQEEQTQQQVQQEPSGSKGSVQAEPEARAPEQQVEAQPLGGQIVEQPEGTYIASELIGQPVMTADGEEMGTITDLLVRDDNRIAGAVIGVGGFLGFGEKRIAVEIDQLARAPSGDGGTMLALDYTRAQLEQAPEFVSLAEQRARAEAEQAQQEIGAGAASQQPGASQTLKQ